MATYEKANRELGFSLIEMMIVIAILGVLAAIALPSYNQHVRKTRRAAGAACAMTAVQQLERFYTTALAYNAAGSPAAFQCDNEAAPYYQVTRSAATARTFTISATPIGAQAGDTCGTLTINQAGTKLPATTGCW